MKNLFLLIFFTITLPSMGQYVSSGYITDNSSGENIPFATISIKGTNIGTVSNNYGFYSLTIDKKYIVDGKVTLVFSFVGYDKIEKTVSISDDVSIDIKLKKSLVKLSSVDIVAQRKVENERLRSADMSVTKIQAKSVKYIPAIAGETDLIKVMQLLPGVSGGAQGSTSMFVRGGDADQNLVLLDEATVYNIGHLFGFFSVFNPDAINDLTMIKGAFPSNYGGRLSSVLDVRMKEGNAGKFHGAGGIGLLSSRIMVEGPIINNKLSFLVSGRRTYIDQVFRMVGMSVPYYFYDLNAKMNYKFSKKDRLYYSFYLGRDVLQINDKDIDTTSSNESQVLDFGFSLGNTTNTLRWNHIYNSKTFSNVSLIVTNFDYNINGEYDNNKLHINSKIFDIGLKADFDYFKNNENHIKYGGSYIWHKFNPNIVSTSGDITSALKSNTGQLFHTHEFALYVLNDMELSKKVRINYGLRFSGSAVENKLYVGLEPRLAVRYLLNETNSLKASYSRMKQYMHRVSSSTATLPTDLWYPITKNIKPQIADQIALGFNHLFEKKMISFEFELYYKKLQNLIEYREGASLMLNNNYEDELLSGGGQAYGAELLIRKEHGKLNGWVSYTISKATRTFDQLNKGERYPAKYDRLHNVSVVVNYVISKRLIFSAVWVYQSGSRFTPQIGQYLMPNATLTGVDIVPIYTKRNAVKMASSHRLDLNLTLKPKKQRKFNSEWSIGCYNLYNRAQPYRVNVVPNDNGAGYKYEQPGLFGFIPSIAYNFNF
jgi:hypothetical protein